MGNNNNNNNHGNINNNNITKMSKIKDLIIKMTTINPNERYTAKECIKHHYFTNNDCYRKVGGDDDNYMEDGNNNINNNKCYNEDIRRNMMNDLLDGLQRVDNYDEDDNF